MGASPPAAGPSTPASPEAGPSRGVRSASELRQVASHSCHVVLGGPGRVDQKFLAQNPTPHALNPESYNMNFHSGHTSPYFPLPTPHNQNLTLNSESKPNNQHTTQRVIRRGVSNRCCTGPGQHSNAWGWAALRTRPCTTAPTTSSSNSPIAQALPLKAAAPPCPRQQVARGCRPASGQAQGPRARPKRTYPKRSRAFSLSSQCGSRTRPHTTARTTSLSSPQPPHKQTHTHKHKQTQI